MSSSASTITSGSNSGFQLSSLWLDQKYRGATIQIIALILLLAFISFIVNNTIQNLNELGVETGYSFLGEPSNYDINQHLIDYDSRSSHFTAFLVGLINTGLVAICGIILATILGFTAGVLRLSKNWLVSRLMYVYVEFTRNVPVLLQILLLYGVIVHNLPQTRGAMQPLENFFLSNRGLYMPKPIFESGFGMVAIAFLIAIVAAILFARYAKKKQLATGEHLPVLSISAGLIIGLPLLVYFIMGSPLSFENSVLKGFNYKGGLAIKPEFMALWLALSLYTGAFIAEIVRAGITSISKGQTEASYALGVKSSWTMRLVVLPQALRVIIPPLISQYLNITKNSSLAIAIGYMDVVATIGGISLNQTGRALECMSIVLGTYLVISLSISALMNVYNKRVALVER